MAARADPAGAGAATAPAAAHVTLRGASKTFTGKGRRVTAFSGVDLDVRPGEFVCLLGPSGCGKSTLLRIVAGTLGADRGSDVQVGGQPVTGPSPSRGMLFQTPLLFGWLTTEGNVLFGPRAQRSGGLNDLDDAEMKAQAARILTTVGLADFAGAYPHELSGGMQHRAAFARALITRPSVLLMDEPFGALDAITRLRMHDFLLAMWSRYRLTVLFVTHDIEEAILLGDRVAIMGGRPARIRQTIGIELERPRRAADVDTTTFLDAKRQIRAALAL